MAKLFEFGAKIHKILNGNSDYSDIPEDYREDINYLTQWVAFLVLGLHQARRGREKFDTLKKSDFQIFEDPTVGKFVKQTVLTSSKNHKNDSEDPESGGIILCFENSFGFNCGQFFIGNI